MKRRRSTETHCANGHPWNEHTRHVDGKSGREMCRYCGYLNVCSRNLTTPKDLSDWILWRETRDSFCKRNHPRTEENIRVDPKTGARICRPCQVESNRRRVYGMGAAEYRELLDSQDGKCALCLKEFKGERDTHLDHDHETGRTRGILCQRCNIGLGHFQEDVATLERAVVYLQTN